MKQLENVNDGFGAPMGRHSDAYLETSIPSFVRLFQVRLNNQGYDDGGAYWGIGTNLWCAIDDDGNRQFTRAFSRERAALLLDIPNPALKKPLKHWCSYGLALLDNHTSIPADCSKADVIDWMCRCGANMGQTT